MISAGSKDTLWSVGTLGRRHVVSSRYSATGGRRVILARLVFWRSGAGGKGCKCSCHEIGMFWCFQNERAPLLAAVKGLNTFGGARIDLLAVGLAEARHPRLALYFDQANWRSIWQKNEVAKSCSVGSVGTACGLASLPVAALRTGRCHQQHAGEKKGMDGPRCGGEPKPARLRTTQEGLKCSVCVYVLVAALSTQVHKSKYKSEWDTECVKACRLCAALFVCVLSLCCKSTASGLTSLPVAALGINRTLPKGEVGSHVALLPLASFRPAPSVWRGGSRTLALTTSLGKRTLAT